MSKKFKILILTKVTPTAKGYADSLGKTNNKLGVSLASYSDLEIDILDNRIKIHYLNQPIGSFDLVYFKTTFGQTEMAVAVANYLKHEGIKFIDQATVNTQITSKIYQYVILSENNVGVVPSIFVLEDKLSKSYDLFKKKLGLPFVLKDVHGRRGRFNYKITGKQSFNKTLKDIEGLGIKLIAQKYIENDGDYRVLVFGDEIYLVIKRQRTNNSTHLNNLSIGGRFSQVPVVSLPIEVQHKAILAAQILGRQIAGVDMVQDKTNGRWYCLEVNEAPQLSTGVLLKEKSGAIASFLEKYISETAK